jgi:hypothetical protein
MVTAMRIRNSRCHSWHKIITRNWFVLGVALFSLFSPPQALCQSAPTEIPFPRLLEQKEVIIPPSGLVFTVPPRYRAREDNTGLPLEEYVRLRTFLEDAKQIGPNTPLAGDSSYITLDLRTGGQLQLWSDGFIKGKLPELTYWVNLFKIKADSTPLLVGMVGLKSGISQQDSAGGKKFTISSLTTPLQVSFSVSAYTASQPLATVRFSRPLQDSPSQAANVGRAGSMAGTSPSSSGSSGAAPGGTWASSTSSPSVSTASSSSTSAGGTLPGSSTRLSTTSGASNGAASGGAGGAPGGPGTIGTGGTGDDSLSCAQIHLGRPTEATIAGGDPNLANSEADYIPVFGGFLRSAWNTVTAVIGPVSVGQGNPNAVTSDSPQNILEGADYRQAGTAGMRTANSQGGSNAFSSSSSSSGGDVLYLDGLGFPNEARGFAGFQWERKELPDGRTAALITAPGSANNALLIFGAPNKLGYSRIQEIHLAREQKILYQLEDQWNATSTYTDPLKGSIITRWTKQPSDNANLFDVIKTTQIGNTIIEEALFTFTHAGGGIFSLSRYKDLSSGATFNFAFGKDSMPLQWTSKGHTANDRGFGNVLRSFDGISGDLNVLFPRDTGLRQQHPSDTPFYTMPIAGIEFNGRQFRTATNTLNQQMETGSSATAPKLFSSFLDVTNPSSTVREFGSDWKSRDNNYAAATISNGFRTEFERNTVGAVTKVRQVFANGKAWESTFEREGYWLKSAQLYNGSKIEVEGDPIHPDAIVYTTALGTYRTEFNWDTYTSGELTQHLLTSITERNPDGSERKATLTWDKDTLTSVTSPDGVTTTISSTEVAARAANGDVIAKVLSSRSFTSYKEVFPSTLSTASSLQGGVIQTLTTFAGGTIHQSSTTLGKGAVNSTTQVTSGVTKNAANDESSTSTNRSARQSIATQSGSGGTSETKATQSPLSDAPTCQTACNGIPCGPQPCSAPWMTAPKQEIPLDGPALSIVRTDTFKDNGRYYLKLYYAHTVKGEAAALVLKGNRAAKVDEFQLNPPLQCGAVVPNLESLNKASTLNCTFENSGGLLKPDGTIEGKMPPLVSVCEVDPEDACGGMEIQLAAGSTVERGNNQPVSGSAYQQGPAFKQNGQTKGFSGVLSNRYRVTGVPALCSGEGTFPSL